MGQSSVNSSISFLSAVSRLVLEEKNTEYACAHNKASYSTKLRPYKITNLILIHFFPKVGAGGGILLFTIDTSLANSATYIFEIVGKGSSPRMRNSNNIFAGGW